MIEHLTSSDIFSFAVGLYFAVCGILSLIRRKATGFGPVFDSEYKEESIRRFSPLFAAEQIIIAIGIAFRFIGKGSKPIVTISDIEFHYGYFVLLACVLVAIALHVYGTRHMEKKR